MRVGAGDTLNSPGVSVAYLGAVLYELQCTSETPGLYLKKKKSEFSRLFSQGF